jgi:hypothetical protein
MLDNLFSCTYRPKYRDMVTSALSYPKIYGQLLSLTVKTEAAYSSEVIVPTV